MWIWTGGPQFYMSVGLLEIDGRVQPVIPLKVAPGRLLLIIKSESGLATKYQLEGHPDEMNGVLRTLAENMLGTTSTASHSAASHKHIVLCLCLCLCLCDAYAMLLCAVLCLCCAHAMLGTTSVLCWGTKEGEVLTAPHFSESAPKASSSEYTPRSFDSIVLDAQAHGMPRAAAEWTRVGTTGEWEVFEGWRRALLPAEPPPQSHRPVTVPTPLNPWAAGICTTPSSRPVCGAFICLAVP